MARRGVERGVSESQQGGGHKAGLLAGLLAVLGGAGKLADDCGRVAKVGGAATHVGDDALRGAGRLGGVGDDVGRAGALAADDALRAGSRAPVVLEAGSPVRLGEGALAKVADDAAPGAGHSVEEALVDTGMDLSLEVISVDLPDEGEDLPSRAVSGSTPAVVTTDGPGHYAEFLRSAVPGALVVVVGQADADGKIALGASRLDDAAIHHRCAEREARCVVLGSTCSPAASRGCLALAKEMARMSAARVTDEGSIAERHAQLVYALLDTRAKTRALDVTISRVDPKADKVVRTRLSSVETRR